MLGHRAACVLHAVAVAAVAGLAAPARAGDPPAPPYPRFDGITFEPSAVAYDPASERVLVLSDKDFILYRFRLSKEGRLELPKGELHREIRLPSGDAVMKLESITRLSDGKFVALTSFDRPDPDYRHMIRFAFAPKGPVEAEELAFPDEAIASELKKVDPEIAWWKVEGLSTTEGDGAALVALRSVGKSHKDKSDVAWILRLPQTERGYGPPERLIRFATEAAIGRAEGASSLERDPRDGSYLLLTSFEGDDADPAGHGGHLFRLPKIWLEGPAPRETWLDGKKHGVAPQPLPKPLVAFQAKPEGLAPLPDGRALVVFDDDTAWKRLFAGYEQSQGLFTLVEPAALAPAK